MSQLTNKTTFIEYFDVSPTSSSTRLAIPLKIVIFAEDNIKESENSKKVALFVYKLIQIC